MKKVVRIIIYEGDDEWVDKTLSKSLKEGYTNISGGDRTIKVVDLETVVSNIQTLVSPLDATDKKDNL